MPRLTVVDRDTIARLQISERLIGECRCVVDTILEEVVCNLRPSGQGGVVLDCSPMKKIRRPDERLSFSGNEGFSARAVRFAYRIPGQREGGLCRFSLAAEARSADHCIADDWPLMRSANVEYRTGFCRHILHRQPDTTHEALWLR